MAYFPKLKVFKTILFYDECISETI